MTQPKFGQLAAVTAVSLTASIGLGTSANAALWQELSIGIPVENGPVPFQTDGPTEYLFEYIPVLKLHFPSDHGECNIFVDPESCDGIGFEPIGQANSFELPGLGTVSLDGAFVGGGMWWINDQDWMIDEIDLFGSAFFTPTGEQQPIQGFGKIWAGRTERVPYDGGIPGILCVADFEFPFDQCWGDMQVPLYDIVMQSDDGIFRLPVKLNPMHMPEPGTAFSLIAGLAGLGFARRRKA